jgi:hypothetical protein
MVALNLLGAAVEKVANIGKDLSEKLNLKELGTNMIQGLVQGIKENAAAVKEAVVGVATGALKSAKQTLGIASPSKEMMKIGEHTAEGFHKGVDAGGGAPGFGKQTPAIAPTGAGGTGPISIQVDVEITGVKGAEDAMDMFRAKMTDVFEQIADGLGGKVLPA